MRLLSELRNFNKGLNWYALKSVFDALSEEIVLTNRTEHQSENLKTTGLSSEHKAEGVTTEKASEQPVKAENVSLKENADGSDAVVKPHADQPLVSVANNQSVPLEEGKAEVENKTEENKKAKPPIVGVPAFAWCCLTSSCICWPVICAFL